MTYQLTESGSIKRALEGGTTLLLPPESNGTLAWTEYQAWLEAGNTPEPAPAPPPPPPEPTINEKLTRIGLTPQDLVAVLEGASGVTIADIKRAAAQAKNEVRI